MRPHVPVAAVRITRHPLAVRRAWREVEAGGQYGRVRYIVGDELRGTKKVHCPRSLLVRGSMMQLVRGLREHLLDDGRIEQLPSSRLGHDGDEKSNRAGDDRASDGGAR